MGARSERAHARKRKKNGRALEEARARARWLQSARRERCSAGRADPSTMRPPRPRSCVRPTPSGTRAPSARRRSRAAGSAARARPCAARRPRATRRRPAEKEKEKESARARQRASDARPARRESEGGRRASPAARFPRAARERGDRSLFFVRSLVRSLSLARALSPASFRSSVTLKAAPALCRHTFMPAEEIARARARADARREARFLGVRSRRAKRGRDRRPAPAASLPERCSRSKLVLENGPCTRPSVPRK